MAAWKCACCNKSSSQFGHFDVQADDFLCRFGEGLTKEQKFSIAGALCVMDTTTYIERLRNSGLSEAEAGIKFACQIDKHIKRRDGFIPPLVVKICNFVG